MSEQHQAEALARWLADGGRTDPPQGIDPDVLEAIYALRPELAPPPRVSIDDILGDVASGPFASTGSGGSGGADAEIVPFPTQQVVPVPPVPVEGANNWRMYVGGTVGLLAAAAAILLILPGPLQQSAPHGEAAMLSKAEQAVGGDANTNDAVADAELEQDLQAAPERRSRQGPAQAPAVSSSADANREGSGSRSYARKSAPSSASPSAGLLGGSGSNAQLGARDADESMKGGALAKSDDDGVAYEAKELAAPQPSDKWAPPAAPPPAYAPKSEAAPADYGAEDEASYRAEEPSQTAMPMEEAEAQAWDAELLDGDAEPAKKASTRTENKRDQAERRQGLTAEDVAVNIPEVLSQFEVKDASEQTANTAFGDRSDGGWIEEDGRETAPYDITAPVPQLITQLTPLAAQRPLAAADALATRVRDNRADAVRAATQAATWYEQAGRPDKALAVIAAALAVPGPTASGEASLLRTRDRLKVSQ